MGETLSTEGTTIPAWIMAVKPNEITKELIFHSNRGSQYASYRLTGILKNHKAPIKQSMGRKGNWWDNAVE